MAFHRKEVNKFASSVAPHRKRETKIRRERKIRKRKRRRERSIIVRTPQGLHPFLLLSSLIPLAHPPTNNTPLHRHQYRFSALCTVYNCTELQIKVISNFTDVIFRAYLHTVYQAWEIKPDLPCATSMVRRVCARRGWSYIICTDNPK